MVRFLSKRFFAVLIVFCVCVCGVCVCDSFLDISCIIIHVSMCLYGLLRVHVIHLMKLLKPVNMDVQGDTKVLIPKSDWIRLVIITALRSTVPGMNKTASK